MATTTVNIKRSQREADAEAKRNLALGLGGAGATLGTAIMPGLGTAIGGALGILTGLLVADETTVLPIDMIAVPAAEYSLVRMGQAPSLVVYIKAGETIQPTGPNVVKSKPTKKRNGSKRDKVLGKQLEITNAKARLKNGSLRKGWTQKKIMTMAQAATTKIMKK